MVAMVAESSGNLGDIQLYLQEKLQSEDYKREWKIAGKLK